MWQPADIPLPADLRIGCTLTTGGVSTGAFAQSNMALHVGDEASAVQANRASLQQLLGYTDVQWLDQVHGNRCVQAPAAGPPPQADACWTLARGLALAVLTADCVPVLLWSERSSATAAVHAGWRGLHTGVLQHTLAAMDQVPSQLCAWIGPCISVQHYEVGEDVWEHFSSDFADCVHAHPRQRHKRLLDLSAIAHKQLSRAGVARVFPSNWCSFADPRFYSFRRSGVTGRMASIIVRLDAC
ncbi:MAG: peptidoglycan editing factor PgeF [bacterium]